MFYNATYAMERQSSSFDPKFSFETRKRYVENQANIELSRVQNDDTRSISIITNGASIDIDILQTIYIASGQTELSNQEIIARCNILDEEGFILHEKLLDDKTFAWWVSLRNLSNPTALL